MRAWQDDIARQAKDEIFQMRKEADIDLKPLLDLMVENTEVLKVFHAGGQDLEIVHNYTGKVPVPLFDAQIAAMAKQTWYASFRFILNLQIANTHSSRRHCLALRMPACPNPPPRDRRIPAVARLIFDFVRSSPLAIEIHATHECPAHAPHVVCP